MIAKMGLLHKSETIKFECFFFSKLIFNILTWCLPFCRKQSTNFVQETHFSSDYIKIVPKINRLIDAQSKLIARGLCSVIVRNWRPSHTSDNDFSTISTIRC